MVRTLVFAAALALGLAGCASVKLKRPEIDNVKTVALIGFSTSIDMSDPSDKNTSTGFGGITNAIKGSATGDERAIRRSEQDEKAYQQLWKAVGEATGWTVLEKAAFASNPEYAKLVAAEAEEGATPAPNKLVRAEIIERLDTSKRTELVKALGVDAVAFARVRYVCGNVSGASFGGMGHTEKHPKAIVELKLYDAQTLEPLWSEIRAEGKPSELGLGRTMGIDSDENETPAILEASKLAFDVLGAHYKEAKQKPVEK